MEDGGQPISPQRKLVLMILDGIGNGEVLPRAAGIVETLRNNDVLVITADHGNNPVASATDHAREDVPPSCLKKVRTTGTSHGTRGSFADVGKDFFGVRNSLAGRSFLAEIA